ncbi:hypothetical protein V8C86DRAFT_2565191 [Haematococcus lacustris]
MLKHLKRAVVQFTPGDPRSASARELLQRLNSTGSKKSNPACKIEFKIDEDAAPGSSFVELHFSDDEQRKIALSATTVDDIARIIERKASAMELVALLKEVGYDPWKPSNRLTSVAAPAPALSREALLSGELGSVGTRM